MTDDSDIVPTQPMRLARVCDSIGLRVTANALAGWVLHPRHISKGMAVRVKHAMNDYLDGKQTADLQRSIASLIVMALVQPQLPAERPPADER